MVRRLWEWAVVQAESMSETGIVTGLLAAPLLGVVTEEDADSAVVIDMARNILGNPYADEPTATPAGGLRAPATRSGPVGRGLPRGDRRRPGRRRAGRRPGERRPEIRPGRRVVGPSHRRCRSTGVPAASRAGRRRVAHRRRPGSRRPTGGRGAVRLRRRQPGRGLDRWDARVGGSDRSRMAGSDWRLGRRARTASGAWLGEARVGTRAPTRAERRRPVASPLPRRTARLASTAGVARTAGAPTRRTPGAASGSSAVGHAVLRAGSPGTAVGPRGGGVGPAGTTAGERPHRSGLQTSQPAGDDRTATGPDRDGAGSRR